MSNQIIEAIMAEKIYLINNIFVIYLIRPSNIFKRWTLGPYIRILRSKYL